MLNVCVRRCGFIGSPLACKNHSACAIQWGADSGASPSGNAEADATASIVAHELVEAVTDPCIDAWYDRNENENADKARPMHIRQFG